MTTIRRLAATLTATALIVAALTCAVASATAYTTGQYAGRTGQGAPITFTVTRGHLTNVTTHVVDRCQPTTGEVTLTGLTASVSKHGALKLVKRLPFGVRVRVIGTLSGRNGAKGTIALDDGACKIREMFRAGRLVLVKDNTPVPVPTNIPKVAASGASISGRGTTVDVTVAALPDDTGAPDTNDSLLVYAAAGTCATTYATAIAQATSGTVIGFIFNSSIASAVDFGHTYTTGSYTFRLTSGSPFASQAASSFATVCAMRYSGQAGMATAATNVVLATAQTPLAAGPGPVDMQP